MAANKKPRKKYRPKPVLKDTITYVLSGIKPLSEDTLTWLKTSLHWAMQTITKGEGSPDDWQNVADSLNMGLVLCERGYGNEYIEHMLAARQAMRALRERTKQKGRMAFTGPELAAVNEAIAIHEAQLDCPDLTVVDVERAVKEVRRRIVSGEASTLP